jgi:FlaA1/EpsC-like NDP-sugar epimerase
MGVGCGGGRMTTDALTVLATGHATSRWLPDVEASRDALRAAFTGRGVLVIGGAGSIGAATLRALLAYAPAAVHVIDQDENGLAELVRDLRSAGIVGAGVDLRLMPLDYGAEVAHRFIATSGPYDAVLHFAALKHVRSEKDPASILQMLDTNVLKQARLMSWLALHGPPERYFAVSTDKAADPVNFMGASKRLMEQLLFTTGATALRDAHTTSARFANVAFSAGSLLESWGERLRKRQPMAVPRDTRRYFVSLEEAAHICLLAACAVPDRHVAVPRLSAASDLRELVPIAEGVARAAGFAPAWYDDDETARASLERDAAAGRWPILRTARDTDGEKAEEIFVGGREAPVEVGLRALQGVPQRGVAVEELRDVLAELTAWVEDGVRPASRESIGATLARVVPEFIPAYRGQGLDGRM